MKITRRELLTGIAAVGTAFFASRFIVPVQTKAAITDADILTGRSVIESWRKDHSDSYKTPLTSAELTASHESNYEKYLSQIKSIGFPSLGDFFIESRKYNLRALGYKDDVELMTKNAATIYSIKMQLLDMWK